MALQQPKIVGVPQTTNSFTEKILHNVILNYIFAINRGLHIASSMRNVTHHRARCHISVIQSLSNFMFQSYQLYVAGMDRVK